MNSVSVIIPAFNAAATIGGTLDALAAQDHPSPFETIVVDDGSTDATADIVRRYPAVRCVHQTNAGPASARNHGARLARGEFLCFTDSDCVPHPDWIAKLVAGFSAALPAEAERESNSAQAGPKIAVVMGSYGIVNPESILARGVHAEIIFRHCWLMPDFPRAFGGYNFCVRAQVFRAVGGFNEAYRAASGEDNDLSYKVISAGHKIFFQRGALVDHHHTEDIVRYLKEQYRHGFWRAFTYADHPRMVQGDGYTFWKDIIEIPWAFVCVLGTPLSCWPAVSLWLFEAYFAWRMACGIFTGFFFTNVMFLRAFARLFGLSSGILAFCRAKCRKKVK